MGVRGDMAARSSSRQSSSKDGAMVYTSHVLETPLLPYEKQLIEAIGSTEEEYRELIAYTLWKGRTRPAAYDGIPDIRAELTTTVLLASGKTATVLTAFGQIVVGAALTLAGYLLTPKPKLPGPSEQRVLDSINHAGRFTPTHGFESLAELANYGDPIPIIFGLYRDAETEADRAGGMLFSPKMVWSRMFSYGTQQGIKMMYAVGEQGAAEGIAPDGIGIPNLQGIFIGNSALDTIYDDFFAFYWKRNTTTSEQSRIRISNMVYGTRGTPSSGDPETPTAGDDAFLCPTKDASEDEGFSSVHSLTSNAQFGCYAPIRNGTPYRVNWSSIPIPHISDGEDDDPHPYIRGYERFKIAGDKGSLAAPDGDIRQNHDNPNRTQNQGMPGVGRNYSCRMGIVDYYKSGVRYQARDGDGTDNGSNSLIPIKVYDDVQVGDRCLFEIRPQGEKLREDLYAKGQVKVEDINSAVDELRRNADEQLQIGEHFAIGACVWKVIKRKKNVWGAVDQLDPDADKETQHITLECIDNNRGSNNKIGVVPISFLHPTISNIKNTKKISAGVVTDRKEWPTTEGIKYGPVDGDGFIGDSPQFGSLPGSSYFPLMRIAQGVVRNNRKTDVTELGIRSIVYQQLNGICNFQSILTVKELRDLDGENKMVQSGTVNSHIQRLSCFAVEWRAAGSTDETEWKAFNAVLGVVGGSTVAQYNWIRIKHPTATAPSAYEFRLKPLSGAVLRDYSDDYEIYRLNADKTTLLEVNDGGLILQIPAVLTKKGLLNNQKEFISEGMEVTKDVEVPARLTVGIESKLPVGSDVRVRKITDFKNPNDSTAFMQSSDSGATAGKMGGFMWEIFGSADSGTYGGSVGVGGTVTKNHLHTVNGKPVRVFYRATKLLLTSSWHGETHGWRVGFDEDDKVDSFESRPEGNDNQGWTNNEIITIQQDLSAENPYRSDVPGTSGDVSWVKMRLKLSVGDEVNIRRGLGHGIPHEIFGQPSYDGETSSVTIEVKDSGMADGQDGNNLPSRTITLKLTSTTHVPSVPNWAGQTLAWSSPIVEVVSTTGTWGNGNDYKFEYLLAVTGSSGRTRNSKSITANPWRNNLDAWIGYKFKINSYVAAKTEERTFIDGARVFEEQTFYADVTRYDGLVRRSNDGGPEHTISYVNEMVSNEDTPQYTKITMAGLSLRAGRNFSNLDQLRFWMSEGLHVERLHPDKNAAYGNTDSYGPSNLLTDLMYFLITDETAGAGSAFGGSTNAKSMVDKEELIQTSKFLSQYKLYFNGSISQPSNLREFISATAPNFLCTFTLKNGKFSLVPALPTSTDGSLKSGTSDSVTIKQYFTSANILENSFEVSYLEAEERKPFRAIVRYRKEVKNQLPKEETVTVTLKEWESSSRALPLESFDLTQFCTTKQHALYVARYFIKLRELVGHTIAFRTTPYGLDLAPGDFIKVATVTSPYDAAKNGTIDGSGVITSASTISDGSYNIFYYPTADNLDIQTGTLNVSGGSTTQSEFFSSVFTVQETTVSATIYRVEQITLEEDASVSIIASEFPCNSNDASLIAWGVANESLYEYT